MDDASRLSLIFSGFEGVRLGVSFRMPQISEKGSRYCQGDKVSREGPTKVGGDWESTTTNSESGWQGSMLEKPLDKRWRDGKGYGLPVKERNTEIELEKKEG